MSLRLFCDYHINAEFKRKTPGELAVVCAGAGGLLSSHCSLRGLQDVLTINFAIKVAWSTIIVHQACITDRYLDIALTLHTVRCTVFQSSHAQAAAERHWIGILLPQEFRLTRSNHRPLPVFILPRI